MWTKLVLSCIFVAVPATTTVLAEPVVETPLGTVTGLVDSSADVPVEVFLGIPYAKPPVDERRFRLPEPFGKFGHLNATKYRSECIQGEDQRHRRKIVFI